MMQSSSSFENESIWDEVPVLRWRQAVDGVKPGAEVLAYAAAADDEPASAAQLAVREIEEDPEAAVRRLSEMRETQAKNALVVARSFGQGKVLMLTTDQSWRLRHRVGDTRHHRFWGQVLRWGSGEKLRAGNTFVRLGTDKLRYKPTEPVKVFARVSDAQYNALNGLKPTLVDLGKALKLEEAEAEIAALRTESEQDGFWNDVERSQKVQQRLKQLQNKCERYKKHCTQWDDLYTICEMALEEKNTLPLLVVTLAA